MEPPPGPSNPAQNDSGRAQGDWSIVASGLVGVRPRIVEFTAALACRPLHWMVSAPQFLFSVNHALMLFRPPNVEFYSLDRIALGVLIFALQLRSFLLRESLGLLCQVTLRALG